MSTIKVNTVTTRSGCTVTLGESGKTVALATGASQTGFGRTGTVDWQTGSIKTSTFTAEDGKGFFCDTTSSAFTVNLPSGSAGAIVSLQDYKNTFDSNALTITPNGSQKINGGAGSMILSNEGQGLTLVYIDSTVGWRSIEENSFSSIGSNFISATGGTTADCGNFRTHTFTSPGTFQVTALGLGGSCTPNELEYIVVAGGAGGGGTPGNTGGGGGAGGFRFASPSLAPATYPGKPLAAPSALTATIASFPITVGAGGTGGTAPYTATPQGASGSSSIFSTITSAGGGGGGQGTPSSFTVKNGVPGGSGGGGGGGNPDSPGGTGNTPPVSPAQGNDGGNGGGGPNSPDHAGAGGGGAGAAGNPCNPGNATGGAGGNGVGIPTAFGASNGVANPSPDAFRYYAGGGGTGFGPGINMPAPAPGGLGGGGGSNVVGTANSGGGGGGGNAPDGDGKTGGSGVVIIRYRFQ